MAPLRMCSEWKYRLRMFVSLSEWTFEVSSTIPYNIFLGNIPTASLPPHCRFVSLLRVLLRSHLAAVLRTAADRCRATLQPPLSKPLPLLRCAAVHRASPSDPHRRQSSGAQHAMGASAAHRAEEEDAHGVWQPCPGSSLSDASARCGNLLDQQGDLPGLLLEGCLATAPEPAALAAELHAALDVSVATGAKSSWHADSDVIAGLMQLLNKFVTVGESALTVNFRDGLRGSLHSCLKLLTRGMP